MQRKETLEWAKEMVAHVFHHKREPEYVEDGIKGWIAKDRNKKLHFFTEKPERNRDVWWSQMNPGNPKTWMHPYTKLPLPVCDMFHYDLTWDDEPVEAEIVFRIPKKAAK